MKNYEETKLRNWFVLALFILFTTVVVFYQSTNSLREASESRLHAYKVMETVQSTLVDMIDAETGERGYIIMGDPSYLEIYNDGRKKINGDIKNIGQLITGDLSQQQRLSRVVPLINERLDHFVNIIHIRKEQGIEAASVFVREDAQKKLMYRIRQALAEMSVEENKINYTQV